MVDSRDMASVVRWLFTAVTVASAHEVVVVLADMLEECGVDPSPLRKPGHPVITVGGTLEAYKDYQYLTVLEQDAYVDGVVDADHLNEVCTYTSQEDYEADHGDENVEEGDE